jgi:hypothetical protein
MRTTVSEYDFMDAFQGMESHGFSYNGLKALYEWFEEYEEGCGVETELDPIAISCDFSEYSSALEVVTDCEYDCDYDNCDDCDDEEDREAVALEYLRDNTTVLEFSGGVIIQGF